MTVYFSPDQSETTFTRKFNAYWRSAQGLVQGEALAGSRAELAKVLAGVDDSERLPDTAGEAPTWLALAQFDPAIMRDPALPMLDLAAADLDAAAWQALDRGMALVLQAADEALRGGATFAAAADLLAGVFGHDGRLARLRTVLETGLPPKRKPVLPSLPLLPQAKLQQLAEWGALRDYLDATRRHGEGAMARREWAAKARAHADGIVAIDPARACPGETVTIRGTGFGKPAPGQFRPAHVELRVPRAGGGCMAVPDVSIEAWDVDQIRIRLPEEVGNGCVGFVELPGPMPTGGALALDVRESAAGLQSVWGQRPGEAGHVGVMLGQAVALQADRLSDFPPLPCPPCLPPDTTGTVPNLLQAGPPEVTLRLNGTEREVQVRPGERLGISWDVSGAVELRLERRLVRIGSHFQDTPADPANLRLSDPGFPFARLESLLPADRQLLTPQPGFLAPVVLDWDLADDWSVDFTLTATSHCSRHAPCRSTVRLHMRESEPLFGLADMHAHLVAHWSFAKVGHWGDIGAPPRDPANLGDPADAKGSVPVPPEGPMALSLRSADGPDGLPPLTLFGGLFASYFAGFGGITGDNRGGWPDFLDWPRADYLGYQQAYIGWLKRAWAGGLRLAACLANHSEFAAIRFLESYESFASPRTSLPQDKDERERLLTDWDAIERQVAAARAMVQWVADNDGGWVEIASTPEEAEKIVAGHRLALVLGVEVGSLGGWRNEQALLDEAGGSRARADEVVDRMVRRLHALGIRHVFPIHGIDNAFGGTALWMQLYDAPNLLMFGRCLQPVTAPVSSGVQYRLDQDTFQGGFGVMDRIVKMLSYHGIAKVLPEVLGRIAAQAAGTALASLFTGGLGSAASLAAGAATLLPFALETPENYAIVEELEQLFPMPPEHAKWTQVSGGHINIMGLTRSGHGLLRSLMRHGMLIDIDHMGMKSLDETLAMCEAHRYPVVASHAEFAEMKFAPGTYSQAKPAYVNTLQFDRLVNADEFGTANVKRVRTERDRTPEQLRRIRALGGMVGTFTAHGDGLGCRCGDFSGSWSSPWRVANRSNGTSEAFAQNFEYLAWHLRGRRASFGTDVNGGAPLPLPRFGPNGARGANADADLQVRLWARDRRTAAQAAAHALPWEPDIPRERAAQVFGQDRPVVYDRGLDEVRMHRWSGTNPKDPAFTADQEVFWSALCHRDAGIPAEDSHWGEYRGVTGAFSAVTRWIAGTQRTLINFGKGLEAGSRQALPLPIHARGSALGALLGLIPDADAQLAAHLASHPGQAPLAIDSRRVHELWRDLSPVHAHWTALRSPATPNAGYPARALAAHRAPGAPLLYDGQGRMLKDRAGRIDALPGRPARDFDFNVDGMAHYGLMPDFIQDLANSGVPQRGLDTLYRGASDYIRVWKLGIARSRDVP